MYVELHTASAFSFLDGASLPATLVERAAALGYQAVALLDRDGVYGAPQFYRAAKAAGLKAIVGAELTIGTDAEGSGPTAQGSGKTSNSKLRTPNARAHNSERSKSSKFEVQSSKFLLPVLVASQAGYRNLCRVITAAKLRAAKGDAVVTLDDLRGQTDGLVALIGREALRAARHGSRGFLDRVVETFSGDNLWVELQRHFTREEVVEHAALVDFSRTHRLPIMASNGVRFATPEARPLYDVFTCLRHKTTLTRAGRTLSVNAERYLKPPGVMTKLFADLPHAIAGTERLAERLEFTLEKLGYQFPEYPVPDGETQASLLRQLTQAGARERFQPYHDGARAQIARELDLIERLQLAGYFLIVWDIVRFCREQGILIQGRGSAANSAVCYALGITAVDPVRMELLFERFLSEERGEWPDIDLDLPSGDRRERVIQYVYERYGARGAGMTANVITYRGRSATREVGKVLELPTDEIDRLARLMNQFEFVDPGETLARHFEEAGLDPAETRYQEFARLWREMQDLPRHLGQHSGGLVISQGRLDEVVPLENASMPGRVVVQWDKDDCADLGIVKVDLLGLGMMAALEEAIVIVNTTAHGSGLTAHSSKLDAPSSKCEVRSSKFDLAHLPPDDPGVYDLLQRADTVGVFQVESRAQMATLPRLKPKNFYDIVVEVAIIRPGPIVGNMVHPYLARRAGAPVTYAHPSLEPVLKRTLGVPLFQEQLLRMAMVVAGFSGGEAEELRRAMGFKRSVKRMQPIETRLREGMARKGITGKAADTIVQSITSFALYGFPESHAASFALLVYASAYLKVHFPAAFVTALLNNQPMGFYSPATLVKDAQRRGVRFLPVDVQVSAWNCFVDEAGKVRLGLRYVKGLRRETGDKLQTANVELRAQDRRVSSMDALVSAANLRQDEVRALAEAGALASFGGHRRTALWQAERVGRPAGPLLGDDDDTNDSESPLTPMTMGERVRADYDRTGLTIGPHPMALVRAGLTTRGVSRAIDLARGRPGRRVCVAGAVITRQRPGTAKGFVFLSLEDETGIANIIVTPDIFAANKRTIVDKPYLMIEGPLQNQSGAVSIKAERVQGLEYEGPELDSHNFH